MHHRARRWGEAERVLAWEGFEELGWLRVNDPDDPTGGEVPGREGVTRVYRSADGAILAEVDVWSGNPVVRLGSLSKRGRQVCTRWFEQPPERRSDGESIDARVWAWGQTQEPLSFLPGIGPGMNLEEIHGGNLVDALGSHRRRMTSTKERSWHPLPLWGCRVLEARAFASECHREVFLRYVYSVFGASWPFFLWVPLGSEVDAGWLGTWGWVVVALGAVPWGMWSLGGFLGAGIGFFGFGRRTIVGRARHYVAWGILAGVVVNLWAWIEGVGSSWPMWLGGLVTGLLVGGVAAFRWRFQASPSAFPVDLRTAEEVVADFHPGAGGWLAGGVLEEESPYPFARLGWRDVTGAVPAARECPDRFAGLRASQVWLWLDPAGTTLAQVWEKGDERLLSLVSSTEDRVIRETREEGPPVDRLPTAEGVRGAPSFMDGFREDALWATSRPARSLEVRRVGHHHLYNLGFGVEQALRLHRRWVAQQGRVKDLSDDPAGLLEELASRRPPGVERLRSVMMVLWVLYAVLAGVVANAAVMLLAYLMIALWGPTDWRSYRRLWPIPVAASALFAVEVLWIPRPWVPFLPEDEAAQWMVGAGVVLLGGYYLFVMIYGRLLAWGKV